jgi:putative pyruvate formate lyase activating enzyme
MVWKEVFEDRGRVFVCGRLELCAGVKEALVEVARTAGGLQEDEAHQTVQNMEKEGRLLTDCWSVDPSQPLQPKNINLQDPPHAVRQLERHHAPETASQSSHNRSVDLSKVPAWPSYLRLVASGELERRIENATNMFSACVACGRFCEANRLSPNPEDWGECRVGDRAIVYAADAHFGEEDCLKGTHGSGTIFFGACNLKCMYRQNWELSMMDEGEVVDDDRLAELMLMLQKQGCHNINFVSPTHNVLAILRALLIAAKNGLKIPIIWNTGGYDSVASLRLLENVVDIYLPDAKYASRAVGRKLSKVDNYPEINQCAIKEMHRQVGELRIDPRTGLAWRGVLVRHLILPSDYAGTYDVAAFLANEVSANTYTNVMDYYHPEYEAKTDRKYGLGRKPTRKELQEAHSGARCACLHRLHGDEKEYLNAVSGCPCSEQCTGPDGDEEQCPFQTSAGILAAPIT